MREHDSIKRSSFGVNFASGTFAGLTILAMLGSGCESKVISAKGIGARQAHPQTHEASPRDKWTDSLWEDENR